MIYSTRRFVLCLALYYFALTFFSPFSIAIISLGEERASLGAFRTFVTPPTSKKLEGILLLARLCVRPSVTLFDA